MRTTFSGKRKILKRWRKNVGWWIIFCDDKTTFHLLVSNITILFVWPSQCDCLVVLYSICHVFSLYMIQKKLYQCNFCQPSPFFCFRGQASHLLRWWSGVFSVIQSCHINVHHMPEHNSSPVLALLSSAQIFFCALPHKTQS